MGKTKMTAVGRPLTAASNIEGPTADERRQQELRRLRTKDRFHPCALNPSHLAHVLENDHRAPTNIAAKNIDDHD